jgi:hypothetical protein
MNREAESEANIAPPSLGMFMTSVMEVSSPIGWQVFSFYCLDFCCCRFYFDSSTPSVLARLKLTLCLCPYACS